MQLSKGIVTYSYTDASIQCGQWGGMTTTSWSTGVSPAENFKAYEARAHFKKEVDAAKIQISVQFESRGILEIRDIELLQAPVKPQS